MNRIKQLIINHKSFFGIFLSVINYVNPRNKLISKGTNVTRKGILCIKGLKISSKGKNNSVSFGNMCIIKNCHITIYGDKNSIIIGDNVSLNSVSFVFEDNNNVISIGNRTSICGKTDLCAIEGTKIQIGQDCLFSGDLHFRTGDSHSVTDMDGNRLNYSENIVISDHVWIGTKVTCLKGVLVPANCVVGAGSLLTKKYNEHNCVIAGNPARVVKSCIDWGRERTDKPQST